MATEDLERWFEKYYFDKGKTQEDLRDFIKKNIEDKEYKDLSEVDDKLIEKSAYFIIEKAKDEGERLSTKRGWTNDGLERQRENWGIIIENYKKREIKRENKNILERAYALRQRESLSQLGTDVTREIILKTSRIRSIKNTARIYGLTIDKMREVLIREGFNVKENSFSK